ncbi:MAG: RluA family pseudouridine synthase [Acidimicrobiales bacterium]|nr:RluA family pseudouridine synthase [Acidimicrobiales bacterium]
MSDRPAEAGGLLPPALDDERLDRVVAFLADVSRAEAAALVAGGAVLVDGRPVTTRAARVAAGSEVRVALPPRHDRPAVAPDPSVLVPLVYVDDEVIVVDKPAGLVVHPGAGHAQGTLVQGLLARFPELAGVGDPDRPGLVHRLDVGTTGLLVVARTSAAHASLVGQLARREVTRRYLALVWGHLTEAAGLVDAPIGRARRDPTRMAVSSQGRAARTRYEAVRAFRDPVAVSLLSCRLETGRTHQIRVHLAAIGHPVVGDRRYGGQRASLPAPRPLLHAAELAFDHPRTGERCTFTARAPADLEQVLEALR